jgi:mitochondrial fission protein ELM1
LTPHRLGEIADSLADMLCAAGGSALVTVSRRSAPAAPALLRDRLKGLSAFIWDGRGENPYFAFLALADAFLVTADTVSMISEAAATGKPVHILELDGGDAKFARFHATMRAAGITRPFAGQIENWVYPIPDDTARAGAALRALLLGNMERERVNGSQPLLDLARLSQHQAGGAADSIERCSARLEQSGRTPG